MVINDRRKRHSRIPVIFHRVQPQFSRYGQNVDAVLPSYAGYFKPVKQLKKKISALQLKKIKIFSFYMDQGVSCANFQEGLMCSVQKLWYFTQTVNIGRPGNHAQACSRLSVSMDGGERREKTRRDLFFPFPPSLVRLFAHPPNKLVALGNSSIQKEKSASLDVSSNSNFNRLKSKHTNFTSRSPALKNINCGKQMNLFRSQN